MIKKFLKKKQEETVRTKGLEAIETESKESIERIASLEVELTEKTNKITESEAALEEKNKQIEVLRARLNGDCVPGEYCEYCEHHVVEAEYVGNWNYKRVHHCLLSAKNCKGFEKKKSTDQEEEED